MKRLQKSGVTLLELIVVVLIVSILSTIAVGVYTKEVLRAKIARTRAEIRTLEVAINRYQIDVGQFPPSGSGVNLTPPLESFPYGGCGYLQVSLRASMSGDARNPLSRRWLGPYMDWDENRLGTLITGSGSGGDVIAGTPMPDVNFLDPFGTPYYYINSTEYDALGGTWMDASNPYFATETYYNASTFQLISLGPDGTTDFSGNAIGTEPDDITNWEGPNI